jgi:hypothetical protein
MTVGQLIEASILGHSGGKTCFGSLGCISVGQINTRVLYTRGIDMSGMLAVEIDLRFRESFLIVIRCSWCLLIDQSKRFISKTNVALYCSEIMYWESALKVSN